MSSKSIGPYAAPMVGSVLETATILGHLLRPEGYTHNVIMDLAIGEFLNHERQSIGEPTSVHLLALKKALLYIIPIISPPGSFEGISLTSQVSCPAIQYNSRQKKSVALAIGDKFRLIGFAFPPIWTNHLATDIFPWKQPIQQLAPLNYISISFNLEVLPGLDRISSTAYLIDSSHYEDVALFNRVNRILIQCINHVALEGASIIASLSVRHPSTRLSVIGRIKPFNTQEYIPKLNAVLPCLINPIYTMSEFECLNMSSNWRLYDEIRLVGFDAPSVSDRMTHLRYVKDETLRAQKNLKIHRQLQLLQTRGEKIARERYPYYFDYTDRRALFVGFSHFSIDKLPSRDRKELNILVEKEIEAQNALLNNRCEHIEHSQYLKQMLRAGTDEETVEAFRRLTPYISTVNTDTMHLCKLCSYPLLCQHEVELYTALESLNFSLETVDNAYLVRQRIINKFKLVNRKRAGDEDTEVGFTFYCKFCGGELGKSNDVIQASIRTSDQSSSAQETSPIDSSIFSGIAHIVKSNMNQTIVPTSHRTVAKLIFNETKDDIKAHIERANKSEKEFIELFIRYLAYVYACASLIAIKVKLDTSEKILIHRDSAREGGAASDIKADFLTAYKIIQANLAFKRIGVTERKIKALLIHAFKSVFASAELPLKASTPLDRLRNDILSSPITKYAMAMYKRKHREKVDPMRVLGIDLSKFAKKGKDKSTKRLFSDIYVPPKNDKRSEFDQYIDESYVALLHTIKEAPLSSIVTLPPSDFIKSFEATRTASFVALRLTPQLNLPCENGREFDFRLTNFQIGYCLDPARPHRWDIIKKDNRFRYICRICKQEKSKVPTDAVSVKSKNRSIEQSLDDQMFINAFFELYTLSCPVKDVHEYVNDTCTLCGVHKQQLVTKDASYYGKYSMTYLEFRRRVTTQLLENANMIRSNLSAQMEKQKVEDAKVDYAKLESLGNGLSKVFGHADMNSLGNNLAGQRVYEIVESYVRILYSHYSFARNLSLDTTSHPDMNFFALVTAVLFPNGAPLPSLPEFPTSKNADRLLGDLFTIIHDAVSIGNESVNKILQYIVDKIVAQESKHQVYNVGRLRTSRFVTEEDDEEGVIVTDNNEDEIDTFEHLFGGYDIDKDEEDNMNGEYE